MTGSQFLEGVAGKEVVAFFRGVGGEGGGVVWGGGGGGGGAVQFLHKK